MTTIAMPSIRGSFVDIALVIVVTVLLGVTVGILLADVMVGIAVTLGTTAAFRLLLTINAHE
ncbi:hypothetical protein [Rhodococcus globerulus]|uniref:hypothetical protein n=1 Tax=Rhodococcus globerulus TaxID=33008 RepID=UPI000B06B2A1|nr:hypothetical protein [Rhodococcus globerulus]